MPERVKDAVLEQLSWDNPDYADARKKGQSTGNVEPFILGMHTVGKYHYLSREFYGEFEAIAKRYGYAVDIRDNRVFDEDAVPIPHKIKLWKSQVPAARAMLSNKIGHQGVLVAPCGGGKTNVLLYVICELGQKTLVLCHTNDLLNQWRQRIRDLVGIEPGIIQGTKIDIQQITLGSVMTLAGRDIDEDLLKEFGCVVLDEAHHCPANSFKDVMDKFYSYFRFGATATPGRRDELEGLLFAICGPIIVEIDRMTLINEGHLVSAEAEPVETGFNYPYRGMRTWPHMIKALTTSRSRNELIIQQIIREHRTGKHTQLVLSKQIDHLLLLHSLLQTKAPSITSSLLVAGGTKKDKRGRVVRTFSMSKREREEAIEAARDGTVRVLFGTQLADEGLDIPRLDRLHLTFPTRAEAKIEQQVGRISRATHGKRDAVVFDYVDEVGLLRDQFSDRRGVYRDMGLKVRPRAKG
jgi:superfamily II DNA or RNA helicase